jgi:hypothetical protein
MLSCILLKNKHWNVRASQLKQKNYSIKSDITGSEDYWTFHEDFVYEKSI